MPMIRIEGITKLFTNKLSLQNVNLRICEGEIFGLIGPNGAGKSTLLSILATILESTSGQVYLNNHNIVEAPELMRKWIGYVPQEIALYPMLSVWENLRFWAQLAPRKVSKERMLALAEIVNISDYLNKKVRTLSGGTKRKLNIATAMLHAPKILIMDEPTVGIDNHSKQEIISYIKGLKMHNVTVVYTTHDFHEIQYLCDRIGVLNNGVLQFAGGLEDGKKKGFLNPYTSEEYVG
jgi:ABC-2 type transport system ATP-binding protein